MPSVMIFIDCHKCVVGPEHPLPQAVKPVKNDRYFLTK